MKNFHSLKISQMKKFSETAFKIVPRGTLGEMKMRTLSVTFESFTNESAEKIYNCNEKFFITIENLTNVSTYKVYENFSEVVKNFHWDDDEMQTLSLQKKEVTFVYEITDESVTKCKIFFDLLLELDQEFTFVIKWANVKIYKWKKITYKKNFTNENFHLWFFLQMKNKKNLHPWIISRM